MSETFHDFKDSFSYGSRSDLSFKFLKRLSDAEAVEFLQRVLAEIGELYDGAGAGRLIDLAYETQVRAYQPDPDSKRPYVYEDRPFEPLAKPLSETTVGLVTSSGHYAAGDPPADGRVGQTQAETMANIDEFLKNAPELSAVPVDLPAEEISVQHPGYDIRSAERDLNVAFPVQILKEAVARRRVGSIAASAYSFVGACAQGRLRRVVDQWIEEWRSAGIEVLFLVPV